MSNQQGTATVHGAPAGERFIDLNSDMGEAYGAYRMGPDAELLQLVTSANVACGFHAGDPRTMEATVAGATAAGVAIGAHVSYPDLVGFGRRHMKVSADELVTDVLYQIGALEAFCRRHGTAVRYVKAHGALYNDLVDDEVLAGALAEAVLMYGSGLSVLTMPGARRWRSSKTPASPSCSRPSPTGPTRRRGGSSPVRRRARSSPTRLWSPKGGDGWRSASRSRTGTAECCACRPTRSVSTVTRLVQWASHPLCGRRSSRRASRSGRFRDVEPSSRRAGPLGAGDGRNRRDQAGVPAHADPGVELRRRRCSRPGC